MDVAEARKVHDQLLANRPDQASHNADICPFCVDKATEDATTSRNPPADGGPDVSDTNQTVPDEHGGRDTSSMSDTMTKETHEALLTKAVADAVSTTEKALQAKTDEAAQLTTELAETKAKLETAEADNTRLNGDLDTAQVNLTAAQDEVAQLKADIAKKDEDAAKAELASKRADQVRNLKLFTDDQIAEKADRWASMSEDDWAERVSEWSSLKPATDAGGQTDAASAMSGTTGKLTEEPASTDTAGSTTTKPSARRAVLGLS